MIFILMLVFFSSSLYPSEHKEKAVSSGQSHTEVTFIAPTISYKNVLYQHSSALLCAINGTLYALRETHNYNKMPLVGNSMEDAQWMARNRQLEGALSDTFKQTLNIMHTIEETQLVPSDHISVFQELAKMVHSLHPNVPLIKTKRDPLYYDAVYKFAQRSEEIKPFYLLELTDVGEYKDLMQKALELNQLRS